MISRGLRLKRWTRVLARLRTSQPWFLGGIEIIEVDEAGAFTVLRELRPVVIRRAGWPRPSLLSRSI